MSNRDVAEVLRRARQMLRNAQDGLEQLEGDDPRRRTAGIQNVATFGRSVTLVLQTLRGAVDAEHFDGWYAPRRAAMAADPLMGWFVELRNEVLKEGGPTPAASIHIENLSGARIQEWLNPPPVGALAMFLGDNLGGSGWMVDGAGGEEKVYRILPPEATVSTSLHLANPPGEHRGRPLEATDIVTLSRLYLAYLEELVDDAAAAFGRQA